MTPRRLAAVAPLLAIALLTGCAEEAGDASADRTSAAPSSSSPVEPSETPAATTSAAPAPSSAAPEWPAAAAPTHGSRVWGVYLTVQDVIDLRDPSLTEVADHAESLGYEGEVSGGQVGCDRGAAEALGIDEYHMSVAIYFDTREQAEQFTALYDRPYVGYAQVTTVCMD